MKIKFMVSIVIFVFVFALLVFSASCAQNNVVFLCDGGSGNGEYPTDAVGDFREAVKLIKDNGGIIVVCGKYTFTELIHLSEKSGTSNGKRTITVTSVYDGVDYRKTNNASLCNGNENYSANMILAGQFIFENININSYGKGQERAIISNGHKIVFGEGITCSKKGDAKYLTLVSGLYDGDLSANYELIIKSGTYGNIYASNRYDEHKGNSTLVIDGGIFEGDILVKGENNKFEINGGNFLKTKNIIIGSENNDETTSTEDVSAFVVNINKYSGDINNLVSKIKGEGIEINIKTEGGTDITPETQATTEETTESITEKPIEETKEQTEKVEENKKQYFLNTQKNTVLGVIVLIAVVFSSCVVLVYRMVQRRK